jgi:hypothetical protein
MHQIAAHVRDGSLVYGLHRRTAEEEDLNLQTLMVEAYAREHYSAESFGRCWMACKALGRSRYFTRPVPDPSQYRAQKAGAKLTQSG